MADSHPTRACPQCGSPHSRRVESRRGTITTIYYLCAEGHGWSESWSEAA